MNRVEKRLLVHFLLILFIPVLILPLLVPPPALAFIPLAYPPVRFDYGQVYGQPRFFPMTQVPTWEDPFKGEGDILVDNFEYWDSPYNHGWRAPEYPWPNYPIGPWTGPSWFTTTLDLQAGSRVLDVFQYQYHYLLRSLMGYSFEDWHSILYSLYTPPSAADTDGAIGISMETHAIFTFDFRAPLGMREQDIPELDIIGEGCGRDITIRLVTKRPWCDECIVDEVHTASGSYTIAPVVRAADGEQLRIDVLLGRDILDGSWHTVWIDLADAVRQAVIHEGLDPDAWCIEMAYAVMITGGRRFRLDDIMFRESCATGGLESPVLFRMGPLHAQLMEHNRYLFVADYTGEKVTVFGGTKNREISRIIDLCLNAADFFIFAEDPDDPNDPVVSYWRDLGADPNLFGENDPAMAALFGRDQFIVDLMLPIFSDPNLRMGPLGPGPAAQKLIDQGALGWSADVSGHSAAETDPSLEFGPLPIDPYDGVPTYLPVHYSVIQVVKFTGKPFFRPDFVFILEGALWNIGMTEWPMIAALDFTPLYIEELMVTLTVTGGIRSDTCIFPLSVVNYEVANHAPVPQAVEDQVFYVGEEGEYLVNFIDPDCFIFNMSSGAGSAHLPGFPVSASYRTDVEGLSWNDYHGMIWPWSWVNYPWSIVHPTTGLIRWEPDSVGIRDMLVTCTDARGDHGFVQFEIFVDYRGTGSNRHPEILRAPEEPVVVRAGEGCLLGYPQLVVQDPDDDELYASCNLGTCNRMPDGTFVWEWGFSSDSPGSYFLSMLPGTYVVEIIFYDLKGGRARTEFSVEVRPWWAYTSWGQVLN
ncbi:MAG: hypothetical protein ACMUIS_12140 [bacterium]